MIQAGDGFAEGYELGQADKESYAQSKVEEYKEQLRKQLRVEIIKRSGPGGADCHSMHTNALNCLEIKSN